MTHRRPKETDPALARCCSAAARREVSVRFDRRRDGKHALPAEGSSSTRPRCAVDICFALGGDGTILNALRTYAGTGVPCSRQLRGDRLPGHGRPRGRPAGLAGPWPATSRCCPCRESSSPPAVKGTWLGFNDVSMHRQVGKRVAHLQYSVGSDEIGRVRCDGLVVATPAGSTGYNLANGGPVMAWGVEGFVVSFIARIRSPAGAGRRPRRPGVGRTTAPGRSRST